MIAQRSDRLLNTIYRTRGASRRSKHAKDMAPIREPVPAGLDEAAISGRRDAEGGWRAEESALLRHGDLGAARGRNFLRPGRQACATGSGGLGRFARWWRVGRLWGLLSRAALRALGRLPNSPPPVGPEHVEHLGANHLQVAKSGSYRAERLAFGRGTGGLRMGR